MSYRPYFWIILLALTGIRCAVALVTPISPEEAYYWLCAQHPAAAYFDGPAGIAFYVRLFESMHAGELVWRGLFPLWGLAASGALFGLGRRIFNDRIAFWSVVLLNVVPLFNESATQVGPLVPALTFLLLGLSAIWRIQTNLHSGIPMWLLAGLAFAAGSFFSYTVAVFAFFAAGFPFLSMKHRRASDAAGAVLMVLLLWLSLVPALRWNAAQDWIPMAGGTFRTLYEFHAEGFLKGLLSLHESFTVLIGLGLLAAWASSAVHSLRQPSVRFVFVAGIPAVVGWIYFSLRDQEAAALLLLGAPLILLRAVGIALNHLPKGGMALVLLAMVLGFGQSVWTGRNAAEAGRRWRDVADSMLSSSAAPGVAEGLFFVAENAPEASLLSYYLKDSVIPPAGYPIVFVRESQDISDQFGLWLSYDDFIESPKIMDEFFTEQKGENPFVGRSAIYVSEEAPDDLPQGITAAFESVSPLGTVPGVGAGKKTVNIYLCRNYQTMPL